MSKPLNIDGLVAKHVMGYGDQVEMLGNQAVVGGGFAVAVRPYSTDISAAFSILDHLKDRFQPSLRKPIRGELSETDFGKMNEVFDDDWECVLIEKVTGIQQMQYCERAATPEMAIVLAALRAHNVPVPGGEGEGK